MHEDEIPADRQPLILMDTGGTFNKRYDPVRGELVVDPGSAAARSILSSAAMNLEVTHLQPVCKDSLEMTAADRHTIVSALRSAVAAEPGAPVVLIHGTDTIDQTAEALAAAFPNLCIVLTGSMRPHAIDPLEPAFNLGMALGFVQAGPVPGVYVAMSGLVRPMGGLAKDRAAGGFRSVTA